MKWDLEERTEDAFVAYLTRNLPGSMRVYPAFSTDAIQYPCVVVGVAATEPISEPASWHDARALEMQIDVATEAAPETDGTGAIIATARERNAAARSLVMDLLAISGLAAQLVASEVAAIAFSQAQVTTTQRSIEDRRLVTTINVQVIAEPVEGT